jgi:hypothetical protein
MPFPAKVQLVQRESGEQFYINFPSALIEPLTTPKARPPSGSSRKGPTSACAVPLRKTAILLDSFERILDQSASGLPAAMRHILAQIVCLGTQPATSLLTGSGRRQQDWPAGDRLDSRHRIESDALSVSVRQNQLDLPPHNSPAVVMVPPS